MGNYALMEIYGSPNLAPSLKISNSIRFDPQGIVVRLRRLTDVANWVDSCMSTDNLNSCHPVNASSIAKKYLVSQGSRDSGLVGTQLQPIALQSNDKVHAGRQ